MKLQVSTLFENWGGLGF